LWQTLGQHFRDPRLIQLFGRYATYCGSSPFFAPATLTLIAHVEQVGVWLPRGGMYALAETMARLASKLGVEFRYGCEAHQIVVERGRVVGVELPGGERLHAGTVVFNGDIAALAAARLGSGAAAIVPSSSGAQRSLSALTWNLVAETSGFPLHRHNVFFSADYPREFDELFAARRLPLAPTVYVCAQDRDGTARACPGRERLLCLVNAPPVGDERSFDPSEIEQCERQSWRLMERCGLRINRTEPMVVTTPTDFERLFPATGGALYGQASHGWRASFNRPGSRTALPGLYLAGGSTHPGAGVPMAALSGRLAAASVLADLDSTSRSRAVAMPGGTSMR
jgi:1-hydroxycarotenoid 3,4-desaturase